MAKTTILLTVDAELSMGGAWSNSALSPVLSDRRIFCRINGNDHGIGWLCNELNARGMRATFFAEVFAALVEGIDETRHWFQFLLERNQDVQLHTHLNYFYYKQQLRQSGGDSVRTDNLADLSRALRCELLNRASDLFETLAGYRARAYRAGNWRGTRELLVDLANAGIVLDSSFNPAIQGRGSFDDEQMRINEIQTIEGIIEVPLTVARQQLPGSRTTRRLRPFDLVSLSCAEMRAILDNAWAEQLPYVMAVLHSFSGVKAADVQYLRMRPNRIVQRRLRFFLDHIAANPDRFQIATVSELVAKSFVRHEGSHKPYDLGALRPMLRTATQALNNFYWV